MNHVFNSTPEKALRLSEIIHNQMKNSSENVDVIDFGAGTKVRHNESTIQVKKIAHTAVSGYLKRKILFNIVHYFYPETIIELGTSLGVTSAGLSKVARNVITLEGNPYIMDIAKTNWSSQGIKNIRGLIGHFDDLLPHLQSSGQLPQMVYVDGNHSYRATLNYYKFFQSWVDQQPLVIIFDDIYWSEEMMKAWKEICAKSKGLTIDIYQFGIVFLNYVSTDPINYTLIPFKYKPWHFGFKPVVK